jgi:hypothetical protein
MSASHQYFYPCKDLLSPEERKQLQNLGGEILKVVEKDGSLFVNLSGVNKDSITDSIDAGKNRKILLFNHGQHLSRICNLGVLYSHIPEMQVHIDSIDKIAERYGGRAWRFCICADDSVEGKIHKDPKFDGLIDVNCNIPISPDYAFYRPTYFYKEKDPETLETIARYARFRSPALLNIQKYHSVGGGDGVVAKSEYKAGIYMGRSFALQILFYEPYLKVIKQFQKKGWLTTTPF